MNIFPAYRIFAWLLVALELLWFVYAFVHDSFAEIPVKWRLPIVIVSGAVMFAMIWLFRDALTIGSTRKPEICTALSICLMFYPFIGADGFFKWGGFWRKNRAMIYLARILFAALIASVDAAMYFLDLLPLPNELSVGGEALLWICILALYSFALTQVFFRLELKIFFQSDNNSDSYNAWLVIPAFTTGNLLSWLWFF
jgi:hypothetical protein